LFDVNRVSVARWRALEAGCTMWVYLTLMNYIYKSAYDGNFFFLCFEWTVLLCCPGRPWSPVSVSWVAGTAGSQTTPSFEDVNFVKCILPQFVKEMYI
jgi:hypothetical protein